jgi:hypothetical protein
MIAAFFGTEGTGVNRDACQLMRVPPLAARTPSVSRKLSISCGTRKRPVSLMTSCRWAMSSRPQTGYGGPTRVQPPTAGASNT